MNGHTVEKIGGTSISNTDAVMDNILVGDRRGADLYGRIFVVSAYAGITNQLLEHKKTGTPGVYALFAGASALEASAWLDAMARLQAEMLKINADRFAEGEDRQTADAFILTRIEDARSALSDLQRLCAHGHFRLDTQLGAAREMLASLGEAHSAHNLTLELRRRGVNARFVDLTAWHDKRALTLDERIQDAFADVDVARELPIATGFGQRREGLMKEFGRGYSEVVFSRIAVLTGAREAIIHKEFHLSSADPNLVGAEAVRKIGRTNYDVADQLANLGMEAIHPRAARGLRHAGIPLIVKNTFEPQDQGTSICGAFISETPRVEIIAGMKGVTTLELLEQDMVGVKGYDSGILEVLSRHDVRIVSKASNANTITHHLDANPKQVKRVISDLEEMFPNAAISTRKVAIVAVIGSDLNVPGLTSRATLALGEGGVEVLGLQQLSRRVDIQFVVSEDSYAAAVIALHRRLVEEDGALARPLRSAA
ncbi:MAG: aspartate kinase [Phenylobacterium sp.]|uniref:aspartate kinase n=1 Tax=Phenylobacterium sp. TaxID=1871053 RepID=UPI002734DD7C|nr:aspartate kinase [Phenylobacterium sp.]MDP1641905.1 aspartate kinase [Phenylobacterium sp.]MDP3116660.1 aspartate kinase [Phenylobacterium sp.]